MSHGTLYESSPASVTNRPRDMRIDPATVAQLRPRRESRAWLGWLLAGLIVGGGVVDVWHMYQERLARDDRGVSQSQSSGQEIPTTGAPR